MCPLYVRPGSSSWWLDSLCALWLSSVHSHWAYVLWVSHVPWVLAIEKWEASSTGDPKAFFWSQMRLFINFPGYLCGSRLSTGACCCPGLPFPFPLLIQVEGKAFCLFHRPVGRKFSLKIKKKNLDVIALQCCVNFCYMAKWPSYRYTYSFPLRFILGYGISFPALFSRGPSLSILHMPVCIC